MKRLTLVLGALVALAGCDADPDAGLVVDPGAGAPPTIEAEAVLSVGVVTGDTLQEFDRVVSPFVLPDGRLVVPLGGSSEIRMFSREGTFVGRLGGSGEGPGEFRYLSAAWPRGDTIEAFDSRLRRVSRFLPDGTVEVVAIPTGAYPDMSVAVGPLGEGWVLGGVVAAGHGERDRILVHRFDRDGAHLGELGSLEGFFRYASGGGGSPHPLSPRAVFASDGTRAYLGDTEVPSIRSVRNGGTDNEIAWEPAESISGEAALEQVIEVALSEGSADQGFFTRERLEAAPVPARASVYWDFLPDREGFLWVQPYEPLDHAFALGASLAGRSGSGGLWWVFTADGRYAGPVGIPEGLALTQITRTAVVGIRRDALGVETVHVHRVNR